MGVVSLEVRELAPGETGAAFEAMHALRGGLRDEADFVERVDGRQRAEGYRLVAVLQGAGEPAAAVAGFHEAHHLSWGHHLYVDDLSTRADARRRGHAARLLDWLEEEAGRLGCGQVHLDSGVGPQRHDAHRLYLNRGLAITAHHFSRALTDPR